MNVDEEVSGLSPLRSLARQFFDGHLDLQTYRERRRGLIGDLEGRPPSAFESDAGRERQPDAGVEVALSVRVDADVPVAGNISAGVLSDAVDPVSADDLVSALAGRAPDSWPDAVNSEHRPLSDPSSDSILQQLSSAQAAADAEASEKKRRGRRFRVYVLLVLLLVAGGLYMSMELGLLTF